MKKLVCALFIAGAVSLTAQTSVYGGGLRPGTNTPASATAPACTSGIYWIAPIAGATNAWQKCENGVLSALGGAALTNSVTGPASPTAGLLTKWGPSGDALVDAFKYGTLTSTDLCTYDATNGLQCTTVSAPTAISLAGGAVGSIPYQNTAAATLFLAGNTATNPKFVTSTGTGTVAQAPVLTSSIGSGSNVVLANNSNGCLDGSDHFPCVVYYNSATGLTVAVTTQNAVVSAAAGQYSFRCTDIVTTAAATSSTLPGCQVGATDPTTNATVTQGGATGSTSNAIGASTINQGFLDVKAAATITYSLPGYASVSASTMTYKYIVQIVREH